MYVTPRILFKKITSVKISKSLITISNGKVTLVYWVISYKR